VTPPPPWWTRRRTRLSILGACLGLALLVLSTSRSSVFSGASGESQAAHWCLPAPLPRLSSVDLDHLAALRASLLGVMRPIGPRRYAWGTIGPENMWSDNVPQRLAAARTTPGRWSAGYEMRTWAADGDDIAASILLFPQASQARAFFDRATSTACHRAGRAALAPRPPRARNLVWLNPDGPMEEDVFLLRGARVYRVADVRPHSSAGSPAAKQQRGLSVVDRLACSLPGADCPRPLATASPQRSS
jgi:hypothetical protein